MGKCKINIFDIVIRILEGTNIIYVNNAFAQENDGYILPEVSISSESETEHFGYGMWIEKSAKVTIKQSQVLYLTVFKDSEITVEDCEFPSAYFGEIGNYGGVLSARNCSFRLIVTYEENAISILTNCTIKDYVRSIKGIIHLINTKVADTLYEDKTLKEGERLP